ncbi:host specificity factor TipJ family phage tail protein [Escherichia coli]|uniref:host specificity factor TipJ family phage tail protein n=2 Tax=Escherichia coli TaxID=562 RepID=UPI003B5BE1EC
MTIRIYPSRLEGEPLETHQHASTTISEWFRKNVNGWRPEMTHPVSVDLNGVSIPHSDWGSKIISPDDDVRIFPVPFGPAAPAWLVWTAVAVAVASAAYSIYMISSMSQPGSSGTQPGNGDQIDLNPAKANTAQLGAAIREIFGKYRVWPDYVMQPVSRFVNETSMETSMFLCVGVGDMVINQSDIKIGNTPISAFGTDVRYTLYPPGATVSGDTRTENWFNSPEVGNTGSGTAGLDLGSSGPETVSIIADALVVSANTITLVDVSASGGDEEIPPSWAVGTVITVLAPNSYTVVSSGGYSVIYGGIDELAPYVGMPVTLNYNGNDYDLVIASYAPGVPAVPGVGGSAATITASAAPTTYDFSTAPVTFSISWHGTTYPVSLVTNYVTMSGLVSSITSQLSGSGLIARDNSGRLEIGEASSPFAGGSITNSPLPASVFGDMPVNKAGVKSTGGTAEVRAHITLAYNSAAGTPFTGLPEGIQRFSLGLAGNQFRITAIDSQTITVERVTVTTGPAGETITTPDPSWPGFNERTLLDATVTGVSDDYEWVGPFLACPDGETLDAFEVNINFQSGLVRYTDKGNKRSMPVRLVIQYRKVGTTTWAQQSPFYSRSTENQIGFTHRYNVSPGQYEIRMRRTEPVKGGSTRDQVFWQALRSRLSKRPTKYEGVTTMALTVRTGNRLAAMSDRRISVTPTRIYNGGRTARSISGALYHVLESLGFTASQIDTAAINALEQTYWTPRGEKFDWASGESKSALEVLQKITNAGMGYFLLSDGLASAGREGIKPWVGMITPQETTEELQTAFKAPSQDDYDGVDVTYINGTTWAEETVQCRLPGNPTPVKIESYTLDGVLNEDRAYRIGMRRLLGYQLQRLQHTTSTEMDALCYEFMDRIVMADDIPVGQQLSCLITDMTYDSRKITMTLSEEPDWSFENPRVIMRLQDGRASEMLTPTRIDDFTISVPYSASLEPDLWVMNDPCIEQPRLLFCSSVRVPYDALIGEITPGNDGISQVTAIQYHPSKYAYDDATYPGDAA